MTPNPALAVVKDDELQREIAPVLQRANEIAVRTPEERTAAVDFAKLIKDAQKKVSDHFGDMKTAAHKAWKTICDKESEHLTPLKAAEAARKNKILAFDAEVERARREEERRLQAEADEKARRERERLEKEAAKLKTPELREERMAQAAAVVAPVITVAPVAEKQKGEATRKIWKARLTDKKALLKAAAEGNELAASFLAFDETAANRTAAATKGAVPVPGIEWYEQASLALGGR